MSSNGLEITADRTSEWAEAFKGATLQALEAVGMAAEGNAVVHLRDQLQGSPFSTGQLMASITHVVNAETKEVFIGTNVEYAPYVELGTGIYYPGGRDTPWVWFDEKGNPHMTRGMRPKPYLKPAAEEHSDEYIDLLKDSYSK